MILQLFSAHATMILATLETPAICPDSLVLNLGPGHNEQIITQKAALSAEADVRGISYGPLLLMIQILRNFTAYKNPGDCGITGL